MKFDAVTLGYAGGIIAALCMLVLSILASIGIYGQMALQMAKWHMFYSVSILGTITGMIEAAIIGFVVLYVFGTIYNALVKK